MNRIFKILTVLLVTVSIFGCGPLRRLCHKNNNDDQSGKYAYSMQIVFDKKFNLYQFDSLCVADTLPILLTKWRKISVQDYESKETIEEYLYIKRLGKNESTYRLIKEDEETYNINKRVVYGAKKED